MARIKAIAGEAKSSVPANILMLFRTVDGSDFSPKTARRASSPGSVTSILELYLRDMVTSLISLVGFQEPALVHLADRVHQASGP